MSIPDQRAPLKKYIWLLIVLNALDGILTYFGMTRGIVEEGNPLLSSFAPFTILGIKLFLSLCLFGLLFTTFAGIRAPVWRYTFIGANVLYSMIFALHLFWLPLLFI
ncbi:DUF5658 family protein [Planococcus salinarum]|uniref:DUF5658 family protein n=1 Tax=Planococcus salinarum TaxID=622695 RepID=UPI000E3D2A74|nr:DUF5658 family protein [Planococcus salinarum]TAA69178.1 hypothetical protein D2909_13235 [Planococcus salinarum]